MPFLILHLPLYWHHGAKYAKEAQLKLLGTCKRSQKGHSRCEVHSSIQEYFRLHKQEYVSKKYQSWILAHPHPYRAWNFLLLVNNFFFQRSNRLMQNITHVHPYDWGSRSQNSQLLSQSITRGQNSAMLLSTTDVMWDQVFCALCPLSLGYRHFLRKWPPVDSQRSKF